MAGGLFESARRKQEAIDRAEDARAHDARSHKARARVEVEEDPDDVEYPEGFEGDYESAPYVPDAAPERVIAVANDEEGRTAQREAYVAFALAIIPSFAETLDDLRQWWVDETKARGAYGIVQNTPSYDRIVQACELRKAELQPSNFTR